MKTVLSPLERLTGIVLRTPKIGAEMTSVLLLGCGKIGRMIGTLLSGTPDYRVTVTDTDAAELRRFSERTPVETLQLDVTDGRALRDAMRGHGIVISALSFHFNPDVAAAALEMGLSYFDLTEDIETTRRVRALAERARPGQVFVPQCGLAPGFISILAHHLTQSFEKLDVVRMRVGALPQFPTNILKYNLTWSTDGLINEYCNPCEAIHEGRLIEVLPLEGLEHFSLDGVRYEAFNTSGGLGTLCETLQGRVRELNYRTIRYPGHRDLMTFLVNDLRLGERRELLKDILERAVPITYQDVVVVLCTASGLRNGDFVQINDARKIYQQEFGGRTWSAIQVTTAAGLCGVLDLHVQGKLPPTGFIRQEQVPWNAFIENRFGRLYTGEKATRFSRVSPDRVEEPVA